MPAWPDHPDPPQLGESDTAARRTPGRSRRPGAGRWLAAVATAVASRSAAVRRWGAGTAAIARLLVAADAPLTGVAIAEAVGVSQPTESLVLKQLADHRSVRPTEHGYVGRPARLLDLYRRRARPLLVPMPVSTTTRSRGLETSYDRSLSLPPRRFGTPAWSGPRRPPAEPHGPGRLGRILQSLPEAAAALERILRPPRTALEVRHPMEFAVEMARLQRERRLNLLAAETLSGAAHHQASILVAAPKRRRSNRARGEHRRHPYVVRSS